MMDSINQACEAFRRLLTEQLDRITHMSKEKKDFSKMNTVTIGIVDGDGIGPIIMQQAVRVLERLLAEERNVKIHVTGNGFVVKGVRRMLQEIIYNLCDNAVKYNVPGGSVHIHAQDQRLTVSDTGIGIPAEHKDRIFERFYRVDKSHSKASGGTGLGLSIVKHAAAYHKAEITLESIPGKGTTITVQF